MIRYICDLCREESDCKNFKLPIAATFVNGNPHDMMPVYMNLCNECKRKIYKIITEIADKNNLYDLNKKAINIKMHRNMDWDE